MVFLAHFAIKKYDTSESARACELWIECVQKLQKVAMWDNQQHLSLVAFLNSIETTILMTHSAKTFAVDVSAVNDQ